MLIVFRVDASLEIGSGHVMRCLTLAAILRTGGAHCRFICRPHQGHLGEFIRKQGHELQLLPMPSELDVMPVHNVPSHARWVGDSWQTDAAQTSAALHGPKPDWLVVDHYGLDARWEQVLRSRCKHLMVIDDLADRPHDCDILLDQNLGREPADYQELVPDTCHILAGTAYALLRPEFAALRATSLERRKNPHLRHILISLGGVDLPNVTGKILEALRKSPLLPATRISVVIGAQSPWLHEVRRIAASLPWETDVLSNISDMATRMAASDLAIGAAGSTSWERCCLGLPAILVCLADNQRRALQALCEAQAALALDASGIDAQLMDTLTHMMSPDTLASFSSHAAALVDGLGTSRVRDSLYEHAR